MLFGKNYDNSFQFSKVIGQNIVSFPKVVRDNVVSNDVTMVIARYRCEILGINFLFS